MCSGAKVASGSAPLAPETRDFLRVAMCAPVIEGYGLTETCGASFTAEPTVVSRRTGTAFFHSFVSAPRKIRTAS